MVNLRKTVRGGGHSHSISTGVRLRHGDEGLQRLDSSPHDLSKPGELSGYVTFSLELS